MAPRSLWRTVLITVMVSAGMVVAAGALLVYGGFYNVAATEMHWPVTNSILETARVRSIQAHARGIAVPAGLDDPGRLPIGTEHFAAHCAVCHGAPGVPKGDIARGMYPEPPDLAAAARHYSDAELFWIIKHGIKMTGMPGWPDHSDDEIWATVAFLKKLGAGMTEQQYGELIRQTMTHGGAVHQHGPAPPFESAPASGSHRH